MNYCDKIHYSLLTASPEDFPSMIDSLLSRLVYYVWSCSVRRF